MVAPLTLTDNSSIWCNPQQGGFHDPDAQFHIYTCFGNRLPDYSGQFRSPGILRGLPDPNCRGIRLATRRFLYGHRHTKPVLGIGQPLFGALAEKNRRPESHHTGRRDICFGHGHVGYGDNPAGASVLGLAVGMGVAGTGFGVILAVVGRASSDDNRSMSLAIATAAGSGGQVVGAPTAEWLLTMMPWQSVFVLFAAAILATLLALPFMRAPQVATKQELEASMGTVLMRALKDPSYSLIFLGFFSCGYQLAFITAHFPAMVTEMCGAIDPSGTLASLGVTSTSALGAVAISLIGLANIAGTLTAGWLGKRYSKKYLLAGIYAGRTIVAALFIMLPITPTSVILFSVGMGALWLATVPLTSGLVAYIYGLRYMGTLYGIVFFSHQLGSFLGVWLGGKMYDLYGSYTAVCGLALGLARSQPSCICPSAKHPGGPATS